MRGAPLPGGPVPLPGPRQGPAQREPSATRALGRRGHRCQRGHEALANLDRSVRLPGQREHLHEDLIHLVGQVPVVARERSSPLQRRLGADQRGSGEGSAGRFEQQAARSRSVAGQLVQVGGSLAPFTRQFRVRPLHRLDSSGGQVDPFGREQICQDGVSGQRVTEPEAWSPEGFLRRHDLCVDRRSQSRQGGCLIEPGDVGDERPIEAPSQHRGGPQHGAILAVEALQALADHSLERLRDSRRQVRPQLPDSLLPHQGSARHTRGEDLLHKERDAFSPRHQQRPHAVR